METFKLPLREIHKRYRKSEIVILSWSSAESSFKMRKQIEESKKGKGNQKVSTKSLNLDQITDKEARSYLAGMGLEFPIMTE